MTPSRWLLAFLLLSAPAVRAQEARFSEAVDVEVVDLDVAVSGEGGAPVVDLTAEDFEVLDDGQPVRITHFSQEGEAEPAAPLHLVLLFDDTEIPPASRSTAFAGVRRQLDRLLGAADRVLVARQGTGLRIEQSFTADRELVDAALDRLERDSPGVPADIASRRAVLNEIRFGEGASENALGPGAVHGGEVQKDTEQSAATSLASVRGYAEGRRTSALRSLAVLDRLASALAGLPGRKAVLLISAGHDLRPGEEVYQAWLAHYRATRAARGSGAVDLEQPGHEIREALKQLAAAAGTSRVAFYTATPTELGGGAEARPELRQAAMSAAAGESRAAESLRLLAEATGGFAVGSVEGIDRLAERLEADRHGNCSFAWASPHRADGAWHSLEVKVRRPGIRVRAPSGYRASTADQRTQDRAASALLLDVADNPLDLGVEVGAGKPERDGSFTVPVTVKIPLARLMLLPKGTGHEGHLSIFLLLRDSQGGLSPTSKLEAPIHLANAGLVEAMGQTGAYATSVRVRPGDYRLAVAVRDDVAAVESAVSVEVKVAEDPKKQKGSHAG